MRSIDLSSHRELPDLVLSPANLLSTHQLHSRVDDISLFWSTIENIIFDILRLHSSDLESFDLPSGIADPWAMQQFAQRTSQRFTHESLSEWLRCVATKNVKRLFLKYSFQMITLSHSLFSCTTLTLLTLNSCILTTFPTDFAGFRHLTECALVHTRMTDDSLARFLSNCPLLHKFNLACIGLQRPIISSLNLTDLVLQLNRPQQLTVNCPKLTTLKTNMCIQDLRVNRMEFYEISSTIESLQIDGGKNLMELSLHSNANASREYNFSVNRFLELVGMLRSLKVLTIDVGNSYGDLQNGIVVPLFNLLSRLPNLERLHLRGRLILAEAEGDQVLTYRIINLQMVEIDVHKYDEKKPGWVGWLLQIAPALKEVKLLSASAGGRENLKRSFQSWESLKKSRERRTMREKTCEISFYF